jgi:hypothetical protein
VPEPEAKRLQHKEWTATGGLQILRSSLFLSFLLFLKGQQGLLGLSVMEGESFGIKRMRLDGLRPVTEQSELIVDQPALSRSAGDQGFENASMPDLPHAAESLFPLQ